MILQTTPNINVQTGGPASGTDKRMGNRTGRWAGGQGRKEESGHGGDKMRTTALYPRVANHLNENETKDIQMRGGLLIYLWK